MKAINYSAFESVSKTSHIKMMSHSALNIPHSWEVYSCTAFQLRDPEMSDTRVDFSLMVTQHYLQLDFDTTLNSEDEFFHDSKLRWQIHGFGVFRINEFCVCRNEFSCSKRYFCPKASRHSSGDRATTWANTEVGMVNQTNSREQFVRVQAV